MADEEMLRLGPNLAFPRDAVTQSFVILGKRRSGKSNTAVVMAEVMYDDGLPWVAFDAKGDWWGIRSSADGTGPGLPVPVFGGLHGDLPLSPAAGRMIADLIVDHNLTCVLDVSRFSDAELARFSTDFARRLYERHQADPQARQVFAEEADRYLPQQLRKGMDDMAASVEAWSLMIRLGGAFGLGVTLITQRSARLNNDGSTQAETMIAHRTTAPVDMKVIREWMAHHHVTQEITDSLPRLAAGEAWVSSSWLAEYDLPELQRERFRQRRTFDSGATPKVGEIRKPSRLADVDLAALRDQMAEVVDQAEQNDPAKLRKRIAELERQARRGRIPDEEWRLAEVGELTAQVTDLQRRLAEAAEPERVEVPVLSPGDIAAFEQQIAALRGMADGIELALGRATRPAPAPVPTPRRPALEPRTVAPTPVAGASQGAVAEGRPALGKRERAILTVLAQYPAGRTQRQIALLTGYSPKASTIGAGLSTLRKNGFASPGGNPALITQAGLDALGGDAERLPTGPSLLDYWNAQLGARERALLAVLLERYPQTVTHAEMAEATGYSPDASTIGAGMSRLRGLELAEGWMAAPDFVEAIQQAREAV